MTDELTGLMTPNITGSAKATPTQCIRGCKVSKSGTHYYKETTDKMIDILERLKESKTRCRFHWGDATTGKDWEDIYDVSGTIGRSTGSCKVPLLIATKRSMGGRAILTQCVVKIVTSLGKRTIYQHPKYHTE